MTRFRMFARRQPAVRLDARSARLAALLTEQLPTSVVIQPGHEEVVFFLLRSDGQVLCTADDPRARGRHQPIRVAIVPTDVSEPITVWSKSVADTSIRWIGHGSTSSVEQAADEVVRHYLPAIDPAQPVDDFRSSTRP